MHAGHWRGSYPQADRPVPCVFVQNDPSVPDGAGPELSPQVAEELQQDESTGRAHLEQCGTMP